MLLIPLYFVIVTAFKTGAEITMNPLGLPETLQRVNFINAFQEGNILRSALNSIMTSAVGVGLLLINAVILSFCCHRLRNQKIGTILYMIILAGLFIPKVGFVSQVILYRRLHIYDTPLAIILGAAVGNIPFSAFILAGFLRTVPRELEEAAMLDGCTDMQLLSRVLAPVIKPALVTVGIFSFCGTWNSVTGPDLARGGRRLAGGRRMERGGKRVPAHDPHRHGAVSPFRRRAGSSSVTACKRRCWQRQRR